MLFYSAYCDADGIREALQLGAQAYLVKGVTPLDEVCATVARHLVPAAAPPGDGRGARLSLPETGGAR